MAGNRDEMRDRPWQPPARHWPEYPEVRAGLDVLAGGSWFGVADHGLVASVLNRHGTLGPAEQRRSRGELVLEALAHGSAAEAARAMLDLNPAAYRGFNLVVGDPTAVYWIRHADDNTNVITVQELQPGLHMIAAGDLDDEQTPRIAHWLPRFRAAALPDPEQGDWHHWQALLAQRDIPANQVRHGVQSIGGDAALPRLRCRGSILIRRRCAGRSDV